LGLGALTLAAALLWDLTGFQAKNRGLPRTTGP
ncbi:hypothetical protein SMCF_8631, partial [Streptomyces coelicoflavus ZG0656]